MNNRSLYFGDNLEVLREKFPGSDGYFDLIYLDPPFNSNRNYNVLFKEGLVDSEAQTHAFEDSWHWTHDAQAEFDHLVTNTNEAISNLMLALEKIVGHNDVLAYLTMMTVRLFELHRVLKPTGSIYLHCDPTASHYLKIVMDTVFGKENFRNEIVWKRHEGHSDAKRFASTHDIIFYYRKSRDAIFNKVHVSYSPEQLSRYKPDETGRLYTGQDLTGAGWSPNRSDEWRGVSPGANRHWMWSLEERERLLAEGKILLRQDGKPRKDGYKVYLDEMPGKVVGDVWTDVERVANTSAERLGYPTQKPEALLERIINASSNEDSWILDPFCGCGTSVSVAENLKRNWVGIDISMLAVKLIERRLVKQHPVLKNHIYINGLPKDLAAAHALFANDPWDFEYWVAVHLLDARPPAGKSKDNMKGADKGIDGIITLITDTQNGHMQYGKVIVQVKGGHVTRSQVSTLISDVMRDKASGGIFVSLEKPTSPMKQEAAHAGTTRSSLGEFPKIQLLTVEELLNGKRANLPGMVSPYKQALAFQATINQTSLL
jgi:site-specific DNA-methyltransferase (adenine-specific)